MSYAVALDAFATAFGSAVIVQAQQDNWVARKGEFCVFNVLRRVSPKVMIRKHICQEKSVPINRLYRHFL